MPETLYILCALTSVLCAFLLIRAYARTKTRLLLWVGLCFVGLAVNNVLLFLDLVIFPTQMDLSLPRALSALVAFVPLLYGLVWDSH